MLNELDTNHMWPLGIWIVTTASKELIFYFN